MRNVLYTSQKNKVEVVDYGQEDLTIEKAFYSPESNKEAGVKKGDLLEVETVYQSVLINGDIEAAKKEAVKIAKEVDGNFIEGNGIILK